MRSALPIAVRDEWDVDAWAVAQVETASAPAFVARGDGTLVAANAFADVFVQQSTTIDTVRDLIEDTCRTGRTQVVRLTLRGKEDGAQLRRFDLTFMPLPSASVFVVAREVTIETNLIGALSASRELFRDLALCATDFSFETDAAGFFTWASPNGALGFSATDLHGSHPRTLFGDCEGIGKFSSRQPIVAEEIWCATKAGGDCCIALTVVPVSGADGQWRGARGVAREVTALRLHERNAENTKRRDELIGAIVGAVRGQIEPRRMMLAAAEALIAATQSHCATLRPSRLEVFASIGEAPAAGGPELGATTSYQGQTNGTISLMREADAPPYGEAERSLVDAVVPHIGVAIALVEALSPTAAQARTDTLTGLLNRASFFNDAKRRMGAWTRAGRSCALVQFDCHNLNPDDDAAGRASRDDFLSAVGRLLSEHDKSGALAARCGRDAFALLFEGTTAADAVAKAEGLCRDVEAIGAMSGLAVEVTSSFGVAFADADTGESLEDLYARCDGALAAAKREGCNCVAVAEPMQKVMPC